MNESRKYSKDEAIRRIKTWSDKREHTHWEAREKLIGWNIPYQEREELISTLIQKNFINEGRYAKAFATDKFRFFSWGKRKIESALKLKGVSERNISDALRVIPDEDTREAIRKLIVKRLPGCKGLQLYQKKSKLARFIIGKGFTPDETWRELENYFRQ